MCGRFSTLLDLSLRHWAQSKLFGRHDLARIRAWDGVNPRRRLCLRLKHALLPLFRPAISTLESANDPVTRHFLKLDPMGLCPSSNTTIPRVRDPIVSLFMGPDF